MARVTSEVRALVELQGYEGLPDETIRDIYRWLRVAPFACAVWTAVGLWTGSAAVILALVPLVAASAAGPWHPFDLVYNLGIRRWRGTAAIPRTGAPRRFACTLIASGLIVVSLWLASGAISTGRRFGMALLLFPAIETATGFCVPSWCFRRMGRRRRTDS